ncbi:hypothetical protein HPP92_015287 [Vanilla planifolia]|uniref:C2H2-type domain-containing protein n=1 Tax=Vanilla planifolia TaxID=51239 RepID=A0A835UU14_VANPL|nr:hypothetical protein HPP92_015819 [Vanilla planifolia]KAG0475601.1 hypothetical protein HPP92_015287 [Vanilla planifolia]
MSKDAGVGIDDHGNAIGDGTEALGKATGDGIEAHEKATGDGVEAYGKAAGDGIEAHGKAAGDGIEAHGKATGDGIEAHGKATGDGIEAHGKAIDKDKGRVQCNYCGKEVRGFNRLKHHLGGVGHDVTECVGAPDDVKAQMKSLLLEKKKERLLKEVGEIFHPGLPLKRYILSIN